ncbi:hypothetical protein [Deinococcus radiophilus]|uniref:hypothetical protein n=1 Tax=Deinococcus radiophilus TaxID=32062 RepID=UPI0036103046
MLRRLDADVVTLMEVQNGGDVALNDLVTALNTAYGREVYRAVQTGTIGTDAIKVAIIYKPASVSPVGGFVLDTDPVHSRPRWRKPSRARRTAACLPWLPTTSRARAAAPARVISTRVRAAGTGCVWGRLRRCWPLRTA